jgi:hypothetical protein
MAETPANDYPVVADTPTRFYVESALTGFGRLEADKVAHSFTGSTGQLFYISAGNVAKLAAPTTNQVLIGSGGGVPTWSSNLAMIRVAQSVVSSAVSSIVFSNIASSGYSAYFLLLDDIVTANASATDALMIQVSTDNGSTWKTTSGDYVTQAGTNRTALTGSGIVCPGATSASPAFSAICEIIGLGHASRVTALSYTSTRSVTAGISMEIPTAALACYRNAREQDNALRIISNAAANITAGTATLLGVLE